jgi:hypothetical protein
VAISRSNISQQITKAGGGKMTKLCPRGKAAAKRKFAVYPSAYANAYASKICAGKIKDPSGKKRKDFRGPKPSKARGGKIKLKGGGSTKIVARGCGAVTRKKVTTIT